MSDSRPPQSGQSYLIEVGFDGKPLRPTYVESNKAHSFTFKAPVLLLGHAYHDGTPVAEAEYEVELENGRVITGRLDKEGKAEVKGMGSRPLRVRYGPDARPYEIVDDGTNPAYLAHFTRETPDTYMEAVRAGKSSSTDTTAFAIEAVDWIWDTVKGGFNEKQTVSQILVDAVIGMIPLVGDVTAARDILAVILGMAQEPKKRESQAEWLALTVLLLALIPVLGGALKGVGKLLLREVKSAEEAAAHLKEIIGVLNHLGLGNAVEWFHRLDLNRYGEPLLKVWRDLMRRLDGVLGAIPPKLKSILPPRMLGALAKLRDKLRGIVVQGEKMIPESVKDLSERLKAAQRKLYSGEWHAIPKDLTSATWEMEARLVNTPAGKRWAVERMAHPQNGPEMFVKRDEWPDLLDESNKTYVKKDLKSKALTYKVIPCFSGPMRAVKLPRDTKIIRVVEGKKSPWGNWWCYALPGSGKEWRENLAVLDSFNENGHYVEMTVPEGAELYAWEGKASSQVENALDEEATLGQYLQGGDIQLFIDFDFAANKKVVESMAKRQGIPLERLLEKKPTHWTDYMGLHVPEKIPRGEFLAPMELTEKSTRPHRKALSHEKENEE